MSTPDLINGLFELFGSVASWHNVSVLYKAKEYKGVSALSTAFFTSWGFWNLFYYPHLGQWASTVGGVSLVFANCVWVGQMMYYSKRRKG